MHIKTNLLIVATTLVAAGCPLVDNPNPLADGTETGDDVADASDTDSSDTDTGTDGSDSGTDSSDTDTGTDGSDSGTDSSDSSSSGGSVCGDGIVDDGEECDDDNMFNGDGCSASCIFEYRKVFVTSLPVTGDLGGLAGAIDTCQTLADDAGLPGTFRAWLSDDGSSPATSFVQSSVPYALVDGTVIAADWDDLIDGDLLEAIQLTEEGNSLPFTPNCNAMGGAAWTGTNNSGAMQGPNCENWTSSVGSGSSGFWESTALWTDGSCQSDCSTPQPLYCFEQ